MQVEVEVAEAEAEAEVVVEVGRDCRLDSTRCFRHEQSLNSQPRQPPHLRGRRKCATVMKHVDPFAESKVQLGPRN